VLCKIVKCRFPQYYNHEDLAYTIKSWPNAILAAVSAPYLSFAKARTRVSVAFAVASWTSLTGAPG